MLSSILVFSLSSSVSNSDYVPLDELRVGPLNEGSRIRCFSVTIINDGICGDDSGHHFTITLSTYADLVVLSPEKTRVYIYDATECSEYARDMQHTYIFTGTK